MAAVQQQPQGRGGNNLLVCDPHGHREWSSGIFSCFNDCHSALLVYFCLPLALCSVSSKLGDCACMPCFVPGSVITMRTRTRTLGGIEGSICGDCMCTSACYLCTVCQMMRELNAMGL